MKNRTKRKYNPSRRLLANYERAKQSQPPLRPLPGSIGNGLQRVDLGEYHREDK